MLSQRVINAKAQLYDLFPYWVQNLSDGFRYIPGYTSWRFNKNGYTHAYKLLKPIHNNFVGCRCVIIGNGPSLKKMDLSVLQDEYTFGLNRIYLMFDELGFTTTFLVSINRLVLQQSATEITKINCPKFLNWNYHKYVDNPDDQTIFLCPRPGWKTPDGEILNGYYPTGGTVTNVAIELAYYMGFSEVILIGVDHSFSDKGVPNKVVVTQGQDSNHFSPNYFGQGYAWQLPDLEMMEQGYKAFWNLYVHTNRKIVDATVGGKLQIFPKVDFEDYLLKSQYYNRRTSNKLDALSHLNFA